MSDELRGLLEGKLGEAVSAAADYAADAIAPSTCAAYIRDWDVFATRCPEQGADPNAMPTHPVRVAAYIASLAGTICKIAFAWTPGPPSATTIDGAPDLVGRPSGNPRDPGRHRPCPRQAGPAVGALTSVEVKRLIAGCAQDLAGLPAGDPALFRIPDALARMRRQMVAVTDPTPLVSFLPKLPDVLPDRDLVDRSAVSSTFVAALELARLAELDLSEGRTFEQVTATPVIALASPSAA